MPLVGAGRPPPVERTLEPVPTPVISAPPANVPPAAGRTSAGLPRPAPPEPIARAVSRTPATPAPVVIFGGEEGWAPLDDGGGDDDVGRDDGPRRDPPPAPSTGDEDGWVPLSADGNEESSEPGRPFIPPLPDDDDVFEPIDSDDDEPPREPPPGATPHDVLEGVRDGTLHVSALNSIPDETLEALADDEGLAPAPGERRADLLRRLLEHRPPEPVREPIEIEGLLELFPEGYGFLRRVDYGYARAASDPIVPPGFVRDLALQAGHWIAARVRPARRDEKYPEVVEILGVNHEEPTAARGIAPVRVA